MFEIHLDATYVWLALALASVVTAGVVSALPTAPAPDAEGAANTIDSVAGSEYVATAEHGLTAEKMRITVRTIELVGGGDRTRATLYAAPVTPVPPAPGVDDRLRRVLDGVPPDAVFEDRESFADAVEQARTGEHEWVPAPDRLTVRGVRYGDLRVTLVG